MNRIRIGVIGLGRMGQHHCRVCSNQKDARLVGVYDVDYQIARETSLRYELPFFDRLEDLLDQVEAVVIATPTPTHFELSLKCLERKLHVLVEKPITDKLLDADYLVHRSQEIDTVFQIGHIERFNPAFIELKKVLERIKLLAISFRRLSPYRVSNTDVDVVLDLMVHDLDLCNEITKNAPVSVSAFGLMPFSNTLDHVSAQLYYQNGPIITLTASRVTEQKIRSIEITSEEAYIEADLMNKSISIHRGSTGEFLGKNRNGVSYHQESTLERILVPSVEPLSSEIKSFLECISAKTAPRVTAYDGLSAIRLASTITEQSYKYCSQKTTPLPLQIARGVLAQ